MSSISFLDSVYMTNEFPEIAFLNHFFDCTRKKSALVLTPRGIYLGVFKSGSGNRLISRNGRLFTLKDQHYSNPEVSLL